MEHSNDITKRPAFRIAIILIILLLLMLFLNRDESGIDGDYVDLGKTGGGGTKSKSRLDQN